uniref:Uncharacterized protein n=1 Tax=Nocardia terpenica TaxID=455432 RepID=A0A0U1YZ65_9NOCA|nr:hypothetical protein [Nocardia terpenica]
MSGSAPVRAVSGRCRVVVGGGVGAGARGAGGGRGARCGRRFPAVGPVRAECGSVNPYGYPLNRMSCSEGTRKGRSRDRDRGGSVRSAAVPPENFGCYKAAFRNNPGHSGVAVVDWATMCAIGSTRAIAAGDV